MNKSIFFIIIILIVVIGGYFLLSGFGTSGPEETIKETVIEESEETIAESEIVSEAREITVIGTEFVFSPSVITVESGERIKIVFQNHGKFPHDFRIEELGIGTRIISPGETDTIEFTAQDSGTFTTFCSVGNHRQAGMEGSLISQ